MIVIIALNFSLIQLAPGDPALALAGEYAGPKYIEAVRREYGLDKPVYERLIIYLSKVLRGDLGNSYAYATPVISVIVERIPATLLLTLTALLISVVVGIFLGAHTAQHYSSKTDTSVSALTFVMYSMPVFWTGLMLILLFAIRLQWFPTSGIVSVLEKKTGGGYILDVLWHLVLPVVTLTIWYMPPFLRVARASVVEVMSEDFIVACRAAGLSDRMVFFKHALRNALLPSVTLIGLRLGFALNGAVLTETVFGWPGMGRLMYEAVFTRDYPLLMGIFLFASLCVLALTLVTDIVYALLDPRVTYA
jgi:peptide/nickel transport system permease protein